MLDSVSVTVSSTGCSSYIQNPNALYRQHFDTVSRWVSYQLGPSEDREDIIQEVFLIAFRQLEGFRGDAKITTWLYGITRNVVRNYRRKARWRRWLSLDDGRPEPPSQGPCPDELLEKRRKELLVYKILDQLREADRTILILFEFEGLSGQEISERMGLSLSNVWVRLSRARQRFLKKLAQQNTRSAR